MKPDIAWGTILVVAVLLFSGGVPVTATDAHYAPSDGWPTALGWSEYGGSLERRGRTPTEGPMASDASVSAATLPGRSFSAPVVDRAGHVYVGDITGKIHRYTPELKRVWSSPALGGEIRSSALVGPDGTVYVAPVAAELVALDGATGKVRWRATVDNVADPGDYVVTGAPAWHPGGMIVQGSMDGNVYAFSAGGKRLWTFQTHADVDNKVVATAAIGADGTIYIGSQNGRLYALGTDGEARWSVRTDALTTPTICPEEQQVGAPSLDDDGTIYVATRLKACGSAGMVYAFRDEGDKASLLWSTNLADKVTAPVTVGPDRTVYVGALDGTFYALAKDDGAIRWDFRAQDDDPGLRDAIDVSLALSVAELAIIDGAGRVYVPYWNVDMTKSFPPQDSLSSPFYALDGDGKIVWRKVFDRTVRSPALMPTTHGMGVLYLAGDDARLHAIGPKDPIPPQIPEETDPPAPPAPPSPSSSPNASSPPVGNDTDDVGDTPPVALMPLLGFLVVMLWAARRRT